jgi:hypothetical protein
LLTDFFVAPSSAQPATLASTPPKGLEFKNLGNLDLADLAAALGDARSAELLKGEEQLVHHNGGEGPWLFRLPVEMVNLLAQTSNADVPGVAARWAAGEQLSFLKAEAADLEPIVSQLRGFADKARREGLSMFLWMSL